MRWRKGISSPLSSIFIPGGACSPPLHREFCSSCMHQGATGEHSRVLCMPAPAGSLFCTTGVSEQVNNQQSCSQGQGCLHSPAIFTSLAISKCRNLCPYSSFILQNCLVVTDSCLCWIGKALSELQLQADNLREPIFFLRCHISPRPRAPNA